MAEQSTNTWNEGGGAGASGSGATGSTGATGGAGSSKSDLRQKVASTVASAADTQKNRAADGLGGIADVARQTGEELRGQNEMLASWVNAASDQLRHLADRLRERPAAELADDLTRFARERPAVFLGGAFLLGLGVARLLKSSPERALGGNGHRGMHGEGSYQESGLGASARDLSTGGTWAPSSGAY